MGGCLDHPVYFFLGGHHFLTTKQPKQKKRPKGGPGGLKLKAARWKKKTRLFIHCCSWCCPDCKAEPHKYSAIFSLVNALGKSSWSTKTTCSSPRWSAYKNMESISTCIIHLCCEASYIYHVIKSTKCRYIPVHIPYTYLAKGPWNRSSNFIFTTKYVIPNSLFRLAGLAE